MGAPADGLNIEMRITVLVLASIAAIVWLWRRGMSPAPNRIESSEELHNAIDYLLRRGIHGGTLRFQVDDDADRSIVFTKYIIRHGEVGCRGHCRIAREPAERRRPS